MEKPNRSRPIRSFPDDGNITPTHPMDDSLSFKPYDSITKTATPPTAVDTAINEPTTPRAAAPSMSSSPPTDVRSIDNKRNYTSSKAAAATAAAAAPPVMASDIPAAAVNSKNSSDNLYPDCTCAPTFDAHGNRVSHNCILHSPAAGAYIHRPAAGVVTRPTSPLPGAPFTSHHRYNNQIAAAHPRKHYTGWKRTYYYWINPYWRMLVGVVLVLYWFMIASNIASYGNVSRGLWTQPQDNDPRLKDYLRDALPDLDPANLSTGEHVIDVIVTWGPVPVVAFMAIWALWSRDWYRIAEICWVEMFVMFWSGVVHSVTSTPDPNGTQAPCHNPEYATLGSWIARNFTATFCGDNFWSGHTFHTAMALWFWWRLAHDYGVATKRWYPIYKYGIPVISFVYLILEMIGLVYLHYHYTMDVVVSALVTLLTVTNRALLRAGVRLLYRPFDGIYRADYSYISDYGIESYDFLLSRNQILISQLARYDPSFAAAGISIKPVSAAQEVPAPNPLRSAPPHLYA